MGFFNWIKDLLHLDQRIEYLLLKINVGQTHFAKEINRLEDRIDKMEEAIKKLDAKKSNSKTKSKTKKNG